MQNTTKYATMLLIRQSHSHSQQWQTPQTCPASLLSGCSRLRHVAASNHVSLQPDTDANYTTPGVVPESYMNYVESSCSLTDPCESFTHPGIRVCECLLMCLGIDLRTVLAERLCPKPSHTDGWSFPGWQKPLQHCVLKTAFIGTHTRHWVYKWFTLFSVLDKGRLGFWVAPGSAGMVD